MRLIYHILLLALILISDVKCGQRNQSENASIYMIALFKASEHEWHLRFSRQPLYFTFKGFKEPKQMVKSLNMQNCIIEHFVQDFEFAENTSIVVGIDYPGIGSCELHFPSRENVIVCKSIEELKIACLTPINMTIQRSTCEIIVHSDFYMEKMAFFTNEESGNRIVFAESFCEKLCEEEFNQNAILNGHRFTIAYDSKKKMQNFPLEFDSFVLTNFVHFKTRQKTSFSLLYPSKNRLISLIRDHMNEISLYQNDIEEWKTIFQADHEPSSVYSMVRNVESSKYSSKASTNDKTGVIKVEKNVRRLFKAPKLQCEYKESRKSKLCDTSNLIPTLDFYYKSHNEFLRAFRFQSPTSVFGDKNLKLSFVQLIFCRRFVLRMIMQKDIECLADTDINYIFIAFTLYVAKISNNTSNYISYFQIISEAVDVEGNFDILLNDEDLLAAFIEQFEYYIESAVFLASIFNFNFHFKNENNDEIFFEFDAELSINLVETVDALTIGCSIREPNKTESLKKRQAVSSGFADVMYKIASEFLRHRATVPEAQEMPISIIPLLVNSVLSKEPSFTGNLDIFSKYHAHLGLWRRRSDGQQIETMDRTYPSMRIHENFRDFAEILFDDADPNIADRISQFYYGLWNLGDSKFSEDAVRIVMSFVSESLMTPQKFRNEEQKRTVNFLIRTSLVQKEATQDNISNENLMSSLRVFYNSKLRLSHIILIEILSKYIPKTIILAMNFFVDFIKPIQIDEVVVPTLVSSFKSLAPFLPTVDKKTVWMARPEKQPQIVFKKHFKGFTLIPSVHQFLVAFHTGCEMVTKKCWRGVLDIFYSDNWTCIVDDVYSRGSCLTSLESGAIIATILQPIMEKFPEALKKSQNKFSVRSLNDFFKAFAYTVENKRDIFEDDVLAAGFHCFMLYEKIENIQSYFSTNLVELYENISPKMSVVQSLHKIIGVLKADRQVSSMPSNEACIALYYLYDIDSLDHMMELVALRRNASWSSISKAMQYTFEIKLLQSFRKNFSKMAFHGINTFCSVLLQENVTKNPNPLIALKEYFFEICLQVIQSKYFIEDFSLDPLIMAATLAIETRRTGPIVDDIFDALFAGCTMLPDAPSLKIALNLLETSIIVEGGTNCKYLSGFKQLKEHLDSK